MPFSCYQCELDHPDDAERHEVAGILLCGVCHQEFRDEQDQLAADRLIAEWAEQEEEEGRHQHGGS